MNLDSFSDFQIRTAAVADKIYSNRELFDFFCTEYVHNGYLYSGSWPYMTLTEKGFHSDEVDSLLAAGLIQKRDCDSLIYELSSDVRKKLIAKHSLCSVWYEKVGESVLFLIQKELREVFGTEVLPCTFSIGQVIGLEYELNLSTPSWNSHHPSHLQTNPKTVGLFMVTDIIQNRLILPHVNMIELQSLSPDFNYAYPHDRSMMLFEDAVIQRITF